MSPDDAGRWAELLAAVEEVDRRDEHYDADDCAEELADPELDLERDTIVVLDGPAGDEGTAMAYQVLRLRSGHAGGAHLISDAGVHPAYRRRGIGNALLGVARERAGELGATLVMRVPETNAGAVALAEENGMGPVRWWSELHRELTEPVAPIPAPPGLAVASLGPCYDAARWDEPLRAAHNSAFADHWGSVPASAEAWVHWRTGSRAFRPACSAVARAAAARSWATFSATSTTPTRRAPAGATCTSPRSARSRRTGAAESLPHCSRACCRRPVIRVTTLPRSPSTLTTPPVPWASTTGRVTA
jgi:mycothiol synthase